MLFYMTCREEERSCFEGQDARAMRFRTILTNSMLDHAQDPSRGCIFLAVGVLHMVVREGLLAH